MDSLVVLGFMLIILINGSYGRQYDMCSLANELYRYGIPQHELSDWVCLAQYASGFDANRIYLNNPDGSWDWGLFQINDAEWCLNSQRGKQYHNNNRCGIYCNQLLNNLHKSIRCAQRVKQSMGFQASIAWRNNCQYNKRDVSHCLQYNRY